jgi:hypothetical protein
MKKSELETLVKGCLNDGKIDYDLLSTKINEDVINPLLEKKTNDVKKEYETTLQEHEELKTQFEELNGTLKTTKVNNLLLSKGVKNDVLDKALKLFDVEDLDNEEQVNAWIEDTKMTIPTFFGDVKTPPLVDKVNPPQDLGQDLEFARMQEIMGVEIK